MNYGLRKRMEFQFRMGESSGDEEWLVSMQKNVNVIYTVVQQI